MLIDSHAHGMHAARNSEGKLIQPIKPFWAPDTMTHQEYISKSRQSGIDKIVLLDPPHVTFELQRIFGDYVIPVPQVDLDKTSPQEINSLFSQGAVGIKFIAPTQPYGCDSYLPIYDAIRANNGLAVFHTGFVGMGLFEPGCVLGRNTMLDITDMRPATLDRIARTFPDLKILMAHFGNPWWEEAWKMISSHKHIYADFSGGTASKRSLNMWAAIFAPDGNLDSYALSKLCFGTDRQYFSESDSFKLPILDFYQRLFDHLNVPDELKNKIYYGNISNLTCN